MICKDCDTLLCVVCKLTEHENHVTSGISKETAERKYILREKIVKAKDKINNVHGEIVKIDTVGDEVKKKFEKSVSELDKRVEAIVASVKLESDKMKQELQRSCDDALSYYATERKKLLQTVTDTETILNHAKNVVEIGDNLQVLDKNLLTKLSSFKEYEGKSPFIKEYLHMTFRPSFTTVNSNLIGRNGKTKHRLNEKERIGIPVFSSLLSDNANVMSLSDKKLHVCFNNFSYLLKFVTESNKPKTIVLHKFSSEGVCSGMTNVKTDIYFTCLSDNIVYKLENNAPKASEFRKMDYLPHGIAFSAYRNELLVCILNSSEVFEINPKEGCVFAVPLEEDRKIYKWREVEAPRATCIASSKSGEIVCLGYPAARKITLHTQNGDMLSEFTGAGCEGNSELFRPVSVCFDVQDCIIIADYGNDAVIRTDESGSYLQCLVKIKRPLSVVIGKEFILNVGSMDNGIVKCVLKVEISL